MHLLRNMAKKHSGFWSKKSSTRYAVFWFKEWRYDWFKDFTLPETHSTTEAERGENCFFFFATCDALHLTCFDELSRKKKLPRFASVENMLYVL